MKTFITLGGEGTATIVEKKSEFIGYAKPVASEAEAAEFVTRIKKKHADARHNVFAYHLFGGTLKRYSDDGEPQGSAGMPVLDVICKNGIDGACVVVTRSFGGILLGTGGLVRAYSATAAAAIEAAGIITLEECTLVELSCSYNDHNRMQNEFARYGAVIENSEFSASVVLTLSMPTLAVESFSTRMRDLSSGRARTAIKGTVMTAPRKFSI